MGSHIPRQLILGYPRKLAKRETEDKGTLELHPSIDSASRFTLVLALTSLTTHLFCKKKLRLSSPQMLLVRVVFNHNCKKTRMQAKGSLGYTQRLIGYAPPTSLTGYGKNTRMAE